VPPLSVVRLTLPVKRVGPQWRFPFSCSRKPMATLRASPSIRPLPRERNMGFWEQCRSCVFSRSSDALAVVVSGRQRKRRLSKTVDTSLTRAVFVPSWN
jgi:hypothetical protein